MLLLAVLVKTLISVKLSSMLFHQEPISNWFSFAVNAVEVHFKNRFCPDLEFMTTVDSSSFGFAFVLADVSRTNTNSIGGTAGYIAPEILHFQNQPTRAADIFSLGVLLWTLATGKLTAGYDTLHAEIDAIMPIEGICRRCLAHNPSERYPQVADLINALSTLPT